MTERCEQCGSSLPPASPSCPICGFDRRGSMPPVPPFPQGPADQAPAGWVPPSGAPFGAGAPAPVGPPASPPPAPSGNRTLLFAVIGAVAVLVVLALVAAALVTRVPEPSDAEPMTPVTATAPPVTVDDTAPSATRSTTSRPPTSRAPVLWTPWQPPDRSFTIDFTGQPEIQTMPADGVVVARGFGAQSETRTAIYVVAWYDIASPRYLADSALMLNSIADNYAEATNLEFTHRGIGHFAGNPSLDFAGTMEEGGETADIRGLELVAGQRVFLFVAGDTGDGSADFDHFRDSFRIGA